MKLAAKTGNLILILYEGPLQLTRRGMLMELCIAVDYSGLEAGVSVAKRYRGCHRDRVV